MKVKFSNKEDLKEFFENVKERNKNSWKKVYTKLDLKRYSFDRYKSGESLIPEEIFENLINFLSKKEKERFKEKIIFLEDNWGKIKGGKRSLLLTKNLENGRIKGLKKIKENNKKRDKEIFESISKIKLSKEICELAGAFIGDGFFNCYQNKSYQIEFTGDKTLDLEYHKKTIIKIIQQIFPDLKPKIQLKKSRNFLRTRFYSKKMFHFLKDFIGFSPGKKAHNIKIPNKIMSSSKENIYSTIRGIFDTDGGVYFDKRKIYSKDYPRIHFSTVSKNLFEQILEILSKEFKMNSTYNKKRKIYSIEIYGENQLKKWFYLIGFSNPRHYKKCLDGLKV